MSAVTPTGIPGSYPMDSESMLGVAPEQDNTDQSSTHRERNKLHKRNDPRGHKQGDSGLGWEASESHQDYNQHNDQSFNDNYTTTQSSDLNRQSYPSEAAGGGMYSRDPQQPVDHFEEKPLHTQPISEEPYTMNRESEHLDQVPRQSTMGNDYPLGQDRDMDHREKDNTTGLNIAGSNKSISAEDKTDSTTGDSGTPPYWGNLPKASGGGIYNTVTGHGSPNDDHDHHHMPRNSTTSDRSHVSGVAATGSDLPTGGVYNTITGHGSQDEESRRHNDSMYLSRPNTQDGNKTLASTDAVIDAPLAGIPEHKPLNEPTDFDATGSSRNNIQPSIMPETAVQDDVRLLASANQRDRHSDIPTQHQTSRKADASPPRAFPLAAAKANDNAHKQDQLAQGDSWPKDEALAGATGVGMGLAAAPLMNKEKRHSTPGTREQYAQQAQAEENVKNQAAGLSASPSTREKDTNKLEKKKSRRASEGSPKSGEKKHHKILGIFHRDSKKNKDTKEDTTITEPTKERRKSDEHHSHKKEGAAGAAGAAGAYGLMHKHKEENLKEPKHYETQPQQQQPILQQQQPVPKQVQHPIPHQPAQTYEQPASGHADNSWSNNKGQAAAGAAGAAGVGAMGYKHHKDHNKAVVDTTPPPPPPTEFPTQVQGPDASSASSTTNTRSSPLSGSPSQKAQETNPGPGPGATPRRRSSSGVNWGRVGPVAAAVAGGAFGSSATYGSNRDSLSSSMGRGQDHSEFDHDVTTPFEHPRQPPSPPQEAVNEKQSRRLSKSKVLASGTPSVDTSTTGGSHRRRSSNAEVMQEAGNYKTLASGTPSGVAVGGVNDSHSRDHNINKNETVNANEDKTNSGHWYTGAAVGAAAAPAAAAMAKDHHKDTNTKHTPTSANTASNKDSKSTDEYNHLASGTPSGVKIDENKKHHVMRQEPPVHHDDVQDGHGKYKTLASGTASGIAAGALHEDKPVKPQFDSIRDRSAENPSSVAGNSHEQTQPQVTTGVYTSSVPAKQTGTAQDGSRRDHGWDRNDPAEKHMSPEVLPSAYRETVTPPQSKEPAEKHMSPEVMPSTYTQFGTHDNSKKDSTPKDRDVLPVIDNETFHPQQGQEQQQQSFVNPAVAAAAGAWAASAGASSGVGNGHATGGKVTHPCQHCGKENDITSYVTGIGQQQQQQQSSLRRF